MLVSKCDFNYLEKAVHTIVQTQLAMLLHRIQFYVLIESHTI